MHRTPLLIAATATAAALLLLLCGGAQAGWRLDRSRAIAEHVWKPACDVRITWGDKNPAAGEEVAWADVDHCTVILRNDVPMAADDEPVDTRTAAFSVLCSIVLHEIGHLAVGTGHSDNGWSIMFPVMWRVDPRCAGRGRPYLTAAGLL